MDRFQQLVLDSEFACCILGNPRAGDYQLVPLGDGLPLSPQAQSGFHARGLALVGVVGHGKNGEFHTALELPLPDHTTVAIAREFCRLMAEKFKAAPAPKDDGAEWLRRLFALPDTRAEN
jgi:hypothetical protein